MPHDEWVEMCRQVEDPNFAHMFDTMISKARSERLDRAVAQQVRVDLAAYFSLVFGTDDDLRLAQRLRMPDVLVSPRQWTGTGESFRGAQYLGM